MATHNFAVEAFNTAQNHLDTYNLQTYNDHRNNVLKGQLHVRKEITFFAIRPRFKVLTRVEDMQASNCLTRAYGNVACALNSLWLKVLTKLHLAETSEEAVSALYQATLQNLGARGDYNPHLKEVAYAILRTQSDEEVLRLINEKAQKIKSGKSREKILRSQLDTNIRVLEEKTKAETILQQECNHLTTTNQALEEANDTLTKNNLALSKSNEEHLKHTENLKGLHAIAQTAVIEYKKMTAKMMEFAEKNKELIKENEKLVNELSKKEKIEDIPVLEDVS